MSEPLFRRAALAGRGERLAGELMLSQPLAASMLVALFAGLTTALILFLASNSYTRKVSVEGRLVPEHGLIEIRSPQGGLLESLHVAAGQRVAAGDLLFELRLDHTLGSEQPLTEALLEQLDRQEEYLQRQLQLQDDAASNLLAGKAAEEQLLHDTLLRLQKMLDAALAMGELRLHAVERARLLFGRGLIALAEFESQHLQALQQQQAIEELELQLQQNQGRLQQLVAERNVAVLQSLQASERMATELAELGQRRLRLLAEQKTAVRAPLDASVGSINLQIGMPVQGQQTVLALLPHDSRLQAELKVPSTAIGFLEEKQLVKLRFDSFPYQKFGVQGAQLSLVNRSMDAQQHAEPGMRPYFRSLAELDKQSISAYGREVPLRPGMSFVADVVVEERSLLEWLLEPLYSLRGHF